MTTTKENMVVRLLPYDEQRIMIRVGNDDEQDIQQKTKYIAGLNIPMGETISSRKYRPYKIGSIRIVKDVSVWQLLTKVFVAPSSLG